MIFKVKWHLLCLIKSFLTILTVFKSSLNSKKSILVVSNALNEGGAPLVLYEAILILKKKYDVVLVSPDVGVIGNKCKDIGVTVLCSKYFSKIIKKMLLSKKWKLIFVNTLVMYDWVFNVDEKNSCVWWIHEGSTYAQKYENEIKNVKSGNNIKIYCVSEWSRQNMDLHGLKTEKQILYYGTKDAILSDEEINSSTDDRLRFLLVGAICERKRTIDLIKSIQKMPNTILEKMDFTIIGKPLNGEQKYYDRFLVELKKSKKKIQYIKSVPHDEIFKMYKQCDVVLDLSIDDPLPVVITEALILKKCVLLSSNCGQYNLIQDGYNGFTFIANDIDDLSNKLLMIYNNRDRLNVIGNESRNLYESLFTIEKFEGEFTKIIDNNIRR